MWICSLNCRDPAVRYLMYNIFPCSCLYCRPVLHCRAFAPKDSLGMLVRWTCPSLITYITSPCKSQTEWATWVHMLFSLANRDDSQTWEVYYWGSNAWVNVTWLFPLSIFIFLLLSSFCLSSISASVSLSQRIPEDKWQWDLRLWLWRRCRGDNR